MSEFSASLLTKETSTSKTQRMSGLPATVDFGPGLQLAVRTVSRDSALEVSNEQTSLQMLRSTPQEAPPIKERHGFLQPRSATSF